jgi:hypothetical protein
MRDIQTQKRSREEFSMISISEQTTRLAPTSTTTTSMLPSVRQTHLSALVAVARRVTAASRTQEV